MRPRRMTDGALGGRHHSLKKNKKPEKKWGVHQQGDLTKTGKLVLLLIFLLLLYDYINKLVHTKKETQRPLHLFYFILWHRREYLVILFLYMCMPSRPYCTYGNFRAAKSGVYVKVRHR